MNKKGFTLIELLAVILILGIIALIAIPTVTNIIKESKRGAFKSSVSNLVNAVEQKCQLQQLKGEEIVETYTFTNGTAVPSLDIKGSLPKGGEIKVDNECNVEVIGLTDGSFIANKEKKSDEIIITEAGELVYVCKRATDLHTEQCTQAGVCGMQKETDDGWDLNGQTVTFGNLGKKGTALAVGDAFDCDVDGDGNFGEYDEATGKYTERFYYVSDYYNTTANRFESDKATLIYYNDVGEETAYYAPAQENWHGPVTAVTQLPKTDEWTNVSLINPRRAILNENKGNTVTAYDQIHNLPTEFDYSGYSARLGTYQEFEYANNNCSGNGCYAFLENTGFIKMMGTEGYWTETSGEYKEIVDPAGYVFVHAFIRSIWNGRSLEAAEVQARYATTRPVIEVYKRNIEN